MIDIYNSQIKVFQIDSDIVKKTYRESDNFLIEYDNTINQKICAIYFSGHSIYFPNDEKTFIYNILEKNRFEWYGQRVPEASKHIFLRDIHKQWYLSGINSTIDSPEKLLSFLKKETEGYEIICIGSSAGGYAALLYGSQLNARIILAFSPRIYMHPLEFSSDEYINPLYFRLKNTIRERYFDISPFILSSISTTYCFYPTESSSDKIQLAHVAEMNLEDKPDFHIVRFRTKKHGVPFPKVALKNLLSYSTPFSVPAKVQNPIIFSIKQVGLINTVNGILHQIATYYRRKIRR